MEWLPPLLENYTLRNIKYKKTNNSIEALGKPETKPKIGLIATKLVLLVASTIESKGWKVKNITPIIATSEIAEKAAGDSSIIDFPTSGLAPAVITVLEKAGIDISKIPDWIKNFRLSFKDIYKAVDGGGGRITAISPENIEYEVTVEVVWFFGRLGVTIRFKQK